MKRVLLVLLVPVFLGCEARPGSREQAALEPPTVDERVHFQMGKQFFREYRAEEVVARYRELLAANPGDVATLNNLAWALATAADVTIRDAEQALALAEKAASLTEGKEPAPLDTLAHCYFYSGQLERAIETEEQAVRLAPMSQGYQRALALFQQAKVETAAQERLLGFTGEGSAVEVELVATPEPPRGELSAEIRSALEEAKELIAQRAWAQARARLEQVIADAPDRAPAYNYLGAVAARTGDTTGAIRFYEQALQRDPEFAAAWNNLAWLLATAKDEAFRDPLRAVASALKAVELTGSRDPDVLDTLAEAYFAAGQYQEAVGAEQKALALSSGEQEHYRRQLGRFLQALDESKR